MDEINKKYESPSNIYTTSSPPPPSSKPGPTNTN